MIESSLELEFGSVTFLENIQIAELNEGILFDIPQNREILAIARERFNNQPYGYISNRVNSYSVNPIIYMEAANFPNLVAVAIVSSNPVAQQNALIEKQFFKNKNSFQCFKTLDEAIIWMKEQF
jgi:hypothetical protein